jgi:AcrR family transcriptional regulator
VAANPERRSRLADAGLALLAREGARGLTYRAVEIEAGLPAGTASNYVRSRDELLGLLAGRIFERLAPDPAFLEEAATKPASVALVGEYVADIHRRLTDRRDLYLALLELRLEATRRPALSELLTGTIRTGFEGDVAFHEQAGLPGGRHEVMLLHLALDGLMVEQLTTPGALDVGDVQATLAGLVERLLAPVGARRDETGDSR